MMFKVGKFKERKIEFIGFLFISISYPIFFPLAFVILIYYKWGGGVNIFGDILKIAIIVTLLFGFLFLFPLVKASICSAKDYKPGKMFLKIKGLSLSELRELILKNCENKEMEYNVIKDKKPDNSFSEILYRKDLFTIKLEDNSIIRIKKNRYFTEDTDVSKQVWDVQYDKTQKKKDGKKVSELLRIISKRLDDYIIN